MKEQGRRAESPPSTTTRLGQLAPRGLERAPRGSARRRARRRLRQSTVSPSSGDRSVDATTSTAGMEGPEPSVASSGYAQDVTRGLASRSAAPAVSVFAPRRGRRPRSSWATARAATGETPFLVAAAPRRVADSGRRAPPLQLPLHRAPAAACPIRPRVLEATVAAVARMRVRGLRASSGSSSAASRWAAGSPRRPWPQGSPADALVFLGYPAPSPRAGPRSCATAPCRGSRAPMLFLQGTRDAFARWDLIEAVVGRLGRRGPPRAVRGRRPFLRRAQALRARRSAEVEARPVRRGCVAWLEGLGL